MSQSARYLLTFILLAAVVLVFPAQAFANHRDVLGDTTSPSAISVPATAEGPGLLLPDSPFFFLDTLKQQLRVAFAFTPEAKAKTYKEIAGERMAELRFMLARNNHDGIRTDLQGIADNFANAALELNQAQLTGRDVATLAKEINTSMREKQQALFTMEQQATGVLQQEVEVSQDTVIRSKVKAEDALPQDLQQNEAKDDARFALQRQTLQAGNLTKSLHLTLDDLSSLATAEAKSTTNSAETTMKKQNQEKTMQSKQIRESENSLNDVESSVKQMDDATKSLQNATSQVDNF